MTRLRIATFNLENLDDRPGEGPLLAERIAVLRPQLERIAADILCLQEINAQSRPGTGPRRLDALDRLLEGTAYAGFARAATRRIGDGGPAGVHNLVTLSRPPILAERQIRHHLVPPIDWRWLTAEPPASATQPVAWVHG